MNSPYFPGFFQLLDNFFQVLPKFCQRGSVLTLHIDDESTGLASGLQER